MSARVNTSQVVYLPSVADGSFLKNTVETLERLRAESEEHGHHLLASLLAITKSEAEDDLKTSARERYFARQQEYDHEAARMAQKLARPAGREAKDSA